ncbi:hypothetical protein Ciccas_013815, partial [Cichlidogyrus casuarinus]
MTVQLNSEPAKGVIETGRMDLICQTSECHPPATVRWFEIPPTDDKATASEITDLAISNESSGEFGGLEVSSTLAVSKTYKSNHGTRYRCVISHPGLSKDLIEEKELNIFYPPSVDIRLSDGNLIQGQSAKLLCDFRDGNPLTDAKVRWKFLKAKLSAEFVESINRGTTISSLANLQRPPALQDMHYLDESVEAELEFKQLQVTDIGWYACE